MVRKDLLEWLRCPGCQTELTEQGEALCCNSCKEVFPVLNSIPRFYGLVKLETVSLPAGIRNPAAWTRWRKRNYKFVQSSLATIPSCALVLDIGAGAGCFKDLLEPFIQHAIDFQPYPDIDVLTDLNLPLPIRTDYFDVVLLSNVLEHIPEPERLLREIYRILKPGGKLIMVTPFIIKIHQAPYDFLRYTNHMYHYLFRKSGFGQYTIEPIGNIGDVHEVVFKVFRKWLLEQHVHWWKRGSMEILIRLSHKLNQLCLKFAGLNKREEQDTFGYPQGYGCVAIKEEKLDRVVHNDIEFNPMR